MEQHGWCSQVANEEVLTMRASNPFADIIPCRLLYHHTIWQLSAGHLCRLVLCRCLHARYYLVTLLKPLSVGDADEIDAIGTKRYESQSGGEREIQRTMLELLNQLDGFDSMGDVKVWQYCW